MGADIESEGGAWASWAARKDEGIIMSKTGQFVWRESVSTKAESSCSFYKALFGWTLKEMPMDGSTYALAHAGEKQVGGIMPMPKMAEGTPSHWMGYVAVDDVDATAVKCTEAGGKVVMPPRDIPNMGRFAILQDPTGAHISAWKSKTPPSETAQAGPPANGEFCWEQLATSDPAAATAFYAKVFGWTSKPFMDNAEVSTMSAGSTQIATIMKAPPGVPSHWLTFVVVGKLADANARVIELGGKVLMPEIPVPNMGAFSVVQDTAGATIGLFEGRA